MLIFRISGKQIQTNLKLNLKLKKIKCVKFLARFPGSYIV